MNKQDRNRAKALRRSKRNSQSTRVVSDREKARRERQAARRAAHAESGAVLAKVLPLSRTASGIEPPRPTTSEGKIHLAKNIGVEAHMLQLTKCTVDTLRDMARDANIKGRSKMSKTELIRAIATV